MEATILHLLATPNAKNVRALMDSQGLLQSARDIYYFTTSMIKCGDLASIKKLESHGYSNSGTYDLLIAEHIVEADQVPILEWWINRNDSWLTEGHMRDLISDACRFSSLGVLNWTYSWFRVRKLPFPSYAWWNAVIRNRSEVIKWLQNYDVPVPGGNTSVAAPPENTFTYLISAALVSGDSMLEVVLKLNGVYDPVEGIHGDLKSVIVKKLNKARYTDSHIKCIEWMLTHEVKIVADDKYPIGEDLLRLGL